MLYLSLAVYCVVTFQVRPVPAALTGGHLHEPVRLTPASPRSQWFFWGYSLSFSPTASPFIGDLSVSPTRSDPLLPLILTKFKFLSQMFGLMGVLDQPSPGSAKVPTIVYAI